MKVGQLRIKALIKKIIRLMAKKIPQSRDQY
jgi:hypothetical protein